MSFPLWRRRVLVTRPRSRASNWVDAFSSIGADVIIYPLFSLELVSSQERDATEQRIAAIAREEDPWLALTSVSAVEHLLALLRESEHLAGVRSHFRIGCVGPATRRVAAEGGLVVAVEPERATGADLARAIVDESRSRRPAVLHPTSSVGRPDVEEAIVQAGGVAHRVVVTVHRPIDRPDAGILDRELREGGIDLLTFASPSAANGLMKEAPEPLAAKLRRIPALAVGGTTAEALRRLRFDRVCTALSPEIAQIAAAAVKSLQTIHRRP